MKPFVSTKRDPDPGRTGARRVEQYRAEAARLRENEPDSYMRIVLEARIDDLKTIGLAKTDPDAFVALWLAAASDVISATGRGAVVPPKLLG